jgi:hypothetical protein
VLAVLAMATSAATYAESRAEPQWPNVNLDGPQWPDVPPGELPDPRPNPQPAFLTPDQIANRILGDHFATNSGNASADVTGSIGRWPDLPPEPGSRSYAYQVGTRYWYSWGRIGFAFSNGDPLFGSPTSTLDWKWLSAHTGEIFGRVDHEPSGWFVKGLVGFGTVVGGEIIDRDFVAQQFSFSDTTSDVKDGSVAYAMIDVGWAYWPVPDIRIGFFGGYHFWRENVTAFGVRCNAVSLPINFCGAPGSVPIPFNVAVLRYEPTWHVLRVGVEGKAAITDRWSVAGEIAAVPFAVVQNKDSHLLRQDFTDLGPAPNVITDSKYALGIAAEMFINYAVTPNIEVGAGVRYWGLVSINGDVSFGPAFVGGFELNSFDQQRIGGLFQVKGKF